MAEQESQKTNVVKAKQQDTKTKEPPTAEEFITRWPLYTPASIGQFEPPISVSFHCDTCGKETTWLLGRKREYINLAEGINVGGFWWVWYLCGLCRTSHLIVLYRDAESGQRPASGRIASGLIPPHLPQTVTVVTKVQKLGRYPAQSVDLPKGLEKTLGPEASSLYKRGLINRNVGYGLGAVTYIRRVVEDKTNELIQ